MSDSRNIKPNSLIGITERAQAKSYEKPNDDKVDLDSMTPEEIMRLHAEEALGLEGTVDVLDNAWRYSQYTHTLTTKSITKENGREASETRSRNAKELQHYIAEQKVFNFTDIVEDRYLQYLPNVLLASLYKNYNAYYSRAIKYVETILISTLHSKLMAAYRMGYVPRMEGLLFTYTNNDSTNVYQLWLEPDIPAALSPDECMKAFESRAAYSTLKRCVIMASVLQKELRQKEVRLANELVSLQGCTYGHLAKERPAWFKIICEAVKNNEL